MNKITLKPITSILILLFMTGCYNAKVLTGEQPSSEKYQKKWAASWINGLVPPKVIEVSEKCSTGVAKVETKLSFPNMLIGGLTLGIYTPMQISATCAEGHTAATVLDAKQDSISVLKPATN